MSKNKISLQQAHDQWLEMVADAGMDRHDHPAMAESWNNYVDSLEKDGQLYALQARYAPAWDEQMPGNGSQWDPLLDDREHVLQCLGITMDCRFVPFSQSRNAGSKDRSLNWKVTFKRDGKPMLKEFDYQQGIGFCPAYKNPPRFNTGAVDQYATRLAIAVETETGKVAKQFNPGSPHIGQTSKTISPPEASHVFHSLLLDSSVLQCRDFAEWAAEYGYDSDSIKAKEVYDTCLRQALELHAALGSARMDELRDLFEDM